MDDADSLSCPLPSSSEKVKLTDPLTDPLLRVIDNGDVEG